MLIKSFIYILVKDGELRFKPQIWGNISYIITTGRSFKLSKSEQFRVSHFKVNPIFFKISNKITYKKKKINETFFFLENLMGNT